MFGENPSYRPFVENAQTFASFPIFCVALIKKLSRDSLKKVQFVQSNFILRIFAVLNTVINEFSEKNIHMVSSFPSSSGVRSAFSFRFRLDNGCDI